MDVLRPGFRVILKAEFSPASSVEEVLRLNHRIMTKTKKTDGVESLADTLIQFLNNVFYPNSMHTSTVP